VAQREVEAVLAEARTEIAAGRYPDVVALRARLAGDPDALARLDRVLAVHRGKTRIAREVSDTKVSDTRSRLRTKVFLSGDLDVRREGESTLAWDPDRSVETWEVRINERADARSDYVLVETREVAEPRVELPLGERPLRVNIVGRSRSGRLVRRAVVTGLTRAGWADRWQRR
jgi:hypothetical protein